jgi:hypothetical protein
MTEEQKKDPDNEYYKTTWWILIEYEYKEAFKRSYEKLSKEDRENQTEELKALPNFDKDIFFKISWIDIEDDISEKIEISIDEIAEKFGVGVEKLEIKK